MSAEDRFSDYFEQIYVINLPERKDRRDEIEYQLTLIGLSLNHPKIRLFNGFRPSEAGEFDSIGARGCFMSHLGVLSDARARKLSRILILEDDLNFANDFLMRADRTVCELDKIDWKIFYGGYQLKGAVMSNENQTLCEVPHTTGIFTAHFIALQGVIISEMVDYLNLLLTRKNGDIRGGPMHVDGAYFCFRNSSPTYKTIASIPELGYQRSSRTDIHQLKWFDKVGVIKVVVSKLRTLKNHLRI